jgi:hypothetical protein
MTGEDVTRLSRSSVPDPEGMILGCGEEPGAVRTDGTGSYRVGMAGEDVAKLSRSSIPDPESAVSGCGEKPGAIGTDGTSTY